MQTQSTAAKDGRWWGQVGLLNAAIVAAGVRLQFPLLSAQSVTPGDWAALGLVTLTLGLATGRLRRLLTNPETTTQVRVEVQILLLSATAWVSGLSLFWRQPGLFWLATFGVIALMTILLVQPRREGLPAARSVFRRDVTGNADD